MNKQRSKRLGYDVEEAFRFYLYIPSMYRPYRTLSYADQIRGIAQDYGFTPKSVSHACRWILFFGMVVPVALWLFVFFFSDSIFLKGVLTFLMVVWIPTAPFVLVQLFQKIGLLKSAKK